MSARMRCRSSRPLEYVRCSVGQSDTWQRLHRRNHRRQGIRFAQRLGYEGYKKVATVSVSILQTRRVRPELIESVADDIVCTLESSRYLIHTGIVDNEHAASSVTKSPSCKTIEI